MRRFVFGMVCLTLAGCVTHRGYNITLKDGREIRSKEFPVLNDVTGYYRCEDELGKLTVFGESEVASIVPREHN